MIGSKEDGIEHQQPKDIQSGLILEVENRKFVMEVPN